MKYVHGILVVNRPDLLELAVESVRWLWPHAFIVDNSPDGKIGEEWAWPIPVLRPSVPLSYPQSMNYLYRVATEKGAHVFGYQHNDAEAAEGSAEEYLNLVTETYASNKRWATVFTHYDILSAYHVPAVREIGLWDTRFPQPNYHADVDWFHRARLLGYETISSSITVHHHNDASSTIKADAHLAMLNSVTGGMNDTYYRKKWGGPPNEEQFATAWDIPMSPALSHRELDSSVLHTDS